MLKIEDQRKFKNSTKITLIESNTKIYVTTEYKFKLMAENRDVNLNHVKAIKNSIKENDMTPVEPILVNEDGFIIDGQHRYTACKELNYPVYFIIESKLNLEHVQLLNTYSKNWDLKSFLESFISQNKTEYLILRDFNKKYPILSLNNCIELTYGIGHNHGSNAPFKNGQFKAYNIIRAEKIAIFLSNLKDNLHIDRSIVLHTYFIRTLITLTNKDNFSLDTFYKKIELNPKKLIRQAGNKDYIRLIEEIYNYRTKEENKVRFF